MKAILKYSVIALAVAASPAFASLQDVPNSPISSLHDAVAALPLVGSSVKAPTSQIFPPSNCSPLQPLVAWDGAGNTYCKSIPVCGPGQALTSLSPGELSCTTIVAAPAVVQPSTAQAIQNHTATSPCDFQTLPNGAVTGGCSWGDGGSTEQAFGSDCTASPEVCAVYESQLGRLPDAAGATYWDGRRAELLAQGLTSAQIQAQLARDMSGTTEYVARNGGTATVSAQEQTAQRNTYNSLLTGVADPNAACTGGTNCSGNAAANAPLNTLQAIYRDSLGRAPDPAGETYWMNMINSGQATIDDVRWAIENSAEAKAK